MSDCIFCSIVEGKVPSTLIYQDQEVFVFRDIHPQANTHLLVIPKKHISTLDDSTAEDELLMGKLLLTASKIAKENKLGGYKVKMSVHKDGGQEVFHVHLHLLSNSTF